MEGSMSHKIRLILSRYFYLDHYETTLLITRQPRRDPGLLLDLRWSSLWQLSTSSSL